MAEQNKNGNGKWGPIVAIVLVTYYLMVHGPKPHLPGGHALYLVGGALLCSWFLGRGNGSSGGGEGTSKRRLPWRR